MVRRHTAGLAALETPPPYILYVLLSVKVCKGIYNANDVDVPPAGAYEVVYPARQFYVLISLRIKSGYVVARGFMLL